MEEMELSIVSVESLDARQRTAVEDLLHEWVDHGSELGFGSGYFHGWTPGEWDDDDYIVTVDTGAQDVEWLLAITDLAGTHRNSRAISRHPPIDQTRVPTNRVIATAFEPSPNCR